MSQRNPIPFRMVVLLALTLASQLSTGGDMQNHVDAPALMSAAQSWSTAFNNGDAKAIAAMYTADAQLLPEGQQAINGRESILKFFTGLMNPQHPDRIRFFNFEFYGSGATVTERSDVEISDATGAIKVRAKQVLIRVKQDGKWKIHRDIWTNDTEAHPN